MDLQMLIEQVVLIEILKLILGLKIENNQPLEMSCLLFAQIFRPLPYCLCAQAELPILLEIPFGWHH